MASLASIANNDNLHPAIFSPPIAGAIGGDRFLIAHTFNLQSRRINTTGKQQFFHGHGPLQGQPGILGRFCAGSDKTLDK